MWSVIKKNPISTFAVLLVAVIGGFLIFMSVWQTTILTSPDWCQRAIRAEQLAPGRTTRQAIEALRSCNSLQQIQLNAIAVDSHIDHGVFGMLLLVLVIVVIAGARASWKISRQGIEGSISRDDPGDDSPKVEGAKEVAGAAIEKVKEVVAEENALPPMEPKP